MYTSQKYALLNTQLAMAGQYWESVELTKTIQGITYWSKVGSDASGSDGSQNEMKTYIS